MKNTCLKSVKLAPERRSVRAGITEKWYFPQQTSITTVSHYPLHKVYSHLCCGIEQGNGPEEESAERGGGGGDGGGGG